MPSEPFFRRDGATFVPTDICRGPWDPNSLHGRVVAGLLAYEIERHVDDSDFLPSRLTVDLYRMPPFAPVTVRATTERRGNRIRIVDAEFRSGDVSIGRASCLLLRRSENPEGNVWRPAPWNVPAPDALPVPPNQGEREPMWDSRVIDHGFGAVARKNSWLRENRLLIEAEPLTPFLRAAISADFTNPFANSGDQGLQFVNADITLYLHRMPVGDWLGYQVTAHHATDGVAIGECTIYDLDGAIGTSTVCGVAQKKRVS